MNLFSLLSRYLTSSKHYSSKNEKVKTAAFLPKDRILSVFGIRGLNDEDIWHIGEKYVTQPIGRNLHGRAEFTPRLLKNHHLVLDIDNNPDGHANIIDWPPEKDAQKSIALDLAESATLILK